MRRALQLRTSAHTQHTALYDSPFARVPEDVIEYIFLHLTPYGDLQSVAQVSQLFYRLSHDARNRLCTLFNRAHAFDWYLLQLPADLTPSTQTKKFAWNIAERCSHSAVYHERRRCVYVYGGCTTNYTAFNDLLCFDLNTRAWTRPLPTGTSPTPKACASLTVLDDGRLLLYGGWSKSSPNPIHQTSMFFNEMHLYDPVANKWSRIEDDEDVARHVAGHSVSVLDDDLIVFGGSSGSVTNNDLTLYNVRTNVWRQAPIAEHSSRPAPRYGQTQVLIDEKHLLLVGGCGGPTIIYNDVWLLTIGEEGGMWMWHKIAIHNPSHLAPAIWSHPGCRVGDNFVTVSKPMYRQCSSPRLTANKVGLCTALVVRVEYNTASLYGVIYVEELCVMQEHGTSSGSLTPPRRKLLTSRSLDEHEPSAMATLATPTGGGRSAELHRASSIPAIIVGEIPTLVVSDDNNVQSIPPPATPPIQLAHSSMLPNQATVVVNEDNSAASQSPPSTSRGITNAISGPRAHPSIRPNAHADRQRQLEMLRKAEVNINMRNRPTRVHVETGQISRPTFRPSSPPPPSQRRHSSSASSSSDGHHNPMTIYVMSLDRLISEHTVTCRTVDSPFDAPEDTILYSLTAADSEMVMFGGMRTRQPHEPAPQLHPGGARQTQSMLSNETYVLRPVVDF